MDSDEYGEQSAKDKEDALKQADMAFMHIAIRALMTSHPEPDGLRHHWKQQLAQFWSKAQIGSLTEGQPQVIRDEMTVAREQMQKVWESYLPPLQE